MTKSNKFSWTWNIRKDCLDEYVAMHKEPWQEILEEHSKAGIRNYSIFQNGHQFFYCFECDDLPKAFQYISQSEVCKRWNAITSGMVEGSFDMDKPSPIEPMDEVFYLP